LLRRPLAFETGSFIVTIKANPMQPLTHHEILGLLAPFTRRGRHVDLAASDRSQRRLAFRRVERACATATATATATAPLRESLELENPDPERYRLTRILELANGLTARLQAEGADLEALLADIEQIPSERQLQGTPEVMTAVSHRLETRAPAGGRSGGGASGMERPPGERLIFAGASARVADLHLRLDEPTRLGLRVDVHVESAGGETLALPEDLFAVLGRAWAPLEREHEGRWRGSLRLRTREPARSRLAEMQWSLGVRHLAATLAEPPRRFHERFAAARWVVVLRRSLPLLACIGLIAGAASVPRLHLAESSGWRMLIFNAPPILMMLFFCLRELPRFEIPPVPRASRAGRWPLRPTALRTN
jgi:hypothetical protein